MSTEVTQSSPSAVSVSEKRAHIGLLILRVVVGVVFLAHGAQKLFTFGIAGTTAGFEQMGVPMAAVVAPLIALLEFLGGIALVLGVGTRLAAALLAIDMLGAILIVHLKAGFFLPNGYEFVLTLFGAAVALTMIGAGEHSVDAVLRKRRGG